MATRRQVDPNRRNAKRSTGSRTEAGKDGSKMNAVRHGILARSVVVPNLEDEAEWRDHRQRVVDDLGPVGGLEAMLADRIAELLWRIRRVAWYERNEVRKNYPDRAAVSWYELQDSGDAGGRELPGLPQLAAISRYEAHLQRSLMQTSRELDRLQSKRRDAVAGPSHPSATSPSDPGDERRGGSHTPSASPSATDGRERSERGTDSDGELPRAGHDETKSVSSYEAEVDALLAEWHAELEAQNEGRPSGGKE